ncbi:hypothetical protein OROHE_005150 [Orobanche hederae]
MEELKPCHLGKSLFPEVHEQNGGHCLIFSFVDIIGAHHKIKGDAQGCENNHGLIEPSVQHYEDCCKGDENKNLYHFREFNSTKGVLEARLYKYEGPKRKRRRDEIEAKESSEGRVVKHMKMTRGAIYEFNPNNPAHYKEFLKAEPVIGVLHGHDSFENHTGQTAEMEELKPCHLGKGLFPEVHEQNGGHCLIFSFADVMGAHHKIKEDAQGCGNSHGVIEPSVQHYEDCCKGDENKNLYHFREFSSTQGFLEARLYKYEGPKRKCRYCFMKKQ